MSDAVKKHVNYTFHWEVLSSDSMSPGVKRVACGEMSQGSDRFNVWLRACEQHHCYTIDEWRELNRRVEELIEASKGGDK